MEMLSNTSGGTGGRIGLDLDHNKLPVTAGDRLQLKFKAKLSGEKTCGGRGCGNKMTRSRNPACSAPSRSTRPRKWK